MRGSAQWGAQRRGMVRVAMIAEKRAGARRARAASSAPRCKLLYIEDDPASLVLVEQLVAQGSGILLLRAASANLGIHLAQAARPDVILLNVDLPGIGATGFMTLVRA